MSRSLIDCKEQPLRRSAVSPVTGEPQLVDWSPIKPTKIANNNVDQSQQSKFKPSLSESVIEHMPKNLTLTSHPPGTFTTAPTTQTATASYGYGYGGDNGSLSYISPMPSPSRSLARIDHPFASPPRLLKPSSPMLRAVSHRGEAGPSIRSTRSSTLRYKSSPSTRHGVTDAGSPYSLPSGPRAASRFDPSQYKSSIPRSAAARPQASRSPGSNTAFVNESSSGPNEGHEDGLLRRSQGSSAAAELEGSHGLNEEGRHDATRLRQTRGSGASLPPSHLGLRRRQTRRNLRDAASIARRPFPALGAADEDDDETERLIPDADDDDDDYLPEEDSERQDWEQGMPSTSVRDLLEGDSMRHSSGYYATSARDSSPRGPEPAKINILRTRPSTIGQALTTKDPIKQNAPRFPSLEEEDFSQEQSINDQPSHVQGIGPGASTSATVNQPSRTSSWRNPKSRPPPIDVLSPKQVKAENRVLKAHRSKIFGLRKPKGVKTFEESVSPGPDSAIDSHDGPSSSTAVRSGVRGLFAKSAAKSQHGGNPVTRTLRKIPSKLGARNFDTVRHNRVRQSAKFPNTVLDPASVHESSRTGNNSQESVLTDPFADPSESADSADPVTPFTAGITAASASSKFESTSQGNLESADPVQPASASMIVHRPSSTAMNTTDTPPDSLDRATKMVHQLLQRASEQADLDSRSQLIELSKCMVQIINKCRDAAMEVEQAKIEAAKKEVTWIEMQKELDRFVPVVADKLANLQN